MILKSFILGNLVSLCMKIINSVVVVGLYYGFLTTFSIGPSYLFLLRARVMEEGEGGTENRVSATTGFITGQLMMFISIYYAPLHLALGRPHTITVLALPYLLFHFFFTNHKHFFDYGSTTKNSMRNLSIQCVFLNNLIFQLFNHFILPSSMLVRLVNIYMFRCNNKMLFLTSSFVGWLIGHILFMKWVGLILVWIQQNHSIRSNVLIRSNKYLMSELRNSMAQIFSILLFITCVYYLGRMPSPIFTKKLKETSKTEEGRESEEETDVEIETTYETKWTKQEKEGSIEEDPSPSLFSEEKEDPDKIDEIKDIFWFEKPIVTILFDYKRWNRPLRYIKNDLFENAVRNQMSQYCFYTCLSDGKERISFTYPPSLLTFFEMIQKKTSLFITEKLSSDELYNHWSYTNEQKRKNLSNDFINRVQALDKGSIARDVLEKSIRLCNDETRKEYLPKKYDPFLNGPYRGKMKNFFSVSSTNKISIQKYIDRIWINRIHTFLLITNYQEFERKMDTFDINSLSTEIGYFLNLVNEFDVKSTLNFKNFRELFFFSEQERGSIYSEDRIKILKFLFDAFITNSNNQTILNRKKSIGRKEISKKVPRWSYKLINDLEQNQVENEENVKVNRGIRARKAKRVVFFTDNQKNTDNYTNTNDTKNTNKTNELALIRYSQQPDFRRSLIKGSMRAQRRKTVIKDLFQANVHSPFFLDRIENPFSFDIYVLLKKKIRNFMWKKTEFKISDYTEKGEKTKEIEEKEEKIKNEKRDEQIRIEIAEAWDSIIFAQGIRGLMLVTQSILRKYIILPSLIIAKNIVRILLFQFPEWSEDFKDWNKEMHIKCTYNGIQLSEREFPKNWLTDGIQIKILFPFRLKPWHRSKLQSHKKNSLKMKEQKSDFSFLTVWGGEAELPFGSARKQLSFFDFEPLFKELEKKIRKLKKMCFIVIRVFKKKTQFFLNILKEWIIKNILFIKGIIRQLSKTKRKLFQLFGLKEIYELSETKKEKDSIISNQMIQESSIQIRSIGCTNYSLTEEKMKDITDRTNTIINQIEKIKNDNKKKVLTPDRNISNKISENSKSKRFESPKMISKILKRRTARLIRKSIFFIKIFIEKIYINLFLSIINIPRINTQCFLDSTKKIIDKSIYHNEENQETSYKTNQNKIHLTFIRKKPFSNITNLDIFCDLSYFSQAYVFYKLSKNPIINLSKLRSVLQYNGKSLFLKNEIKDYFVTQGIFCSELRHNNLQNYGINEWKNWLRGQYQYNLSKIKWSKFVPKKWRNRVNQHCMAQNTDLNKCNSYEKDLLIYYEKKKKFEIDLLQKKINKLKKYRYNLFAYKSITYNYEYKKDLYIYKSPLPLQVNQNKEISSNSNPHKNKLFDIIKSLSFNNLIVEDDIMDLEKNRDRKYFDWKILKFYLRKKIDIEAWIDIDTGTKNNQNTTTGPNNNYQIIDKIKKKGLCYLTIDPKIKPYNLKKTFFVFDWMGMNEEILSCPGLNLNFGNPKFERLYNVYKIQPWIIPFKFLFFNLNGNENFSKNKNITGTKKGDPFISSNKKKSLELENKEEKKKKEAIGQANLPSTFSSQEKDVEEDFGTSDIKKRRKKKQYKSKTEAQLDLFLQRYLRFQLKWKDSLNKKIFNNIKVYSLLLRLIDPNEIVLSSIQSEEMSLDIMIIKKELTITELLKQGLLIIEPICLSVKNDGKFLMYQTISISLFHKSKHEINQRYQEKNYVHENPFDQSSAKYQQIIGNRDENTNNYGLLVPENILSPRRRRKLRILIFFNSMNRKKDIQINTAFFNSANVKNFNQMLDRSKYLHLDSDKKKFQNKLIKSKFFLWPNYRLEDLACMNRYWFDTNNGSRFTMVRIHMYPRLKIR
uniref:hypothetical chloroplast RF1 n=1 Tax=Tribulus terrestris TaxID=210369 RepID=UPI00143694E6|nr:hypothetical chloroplast RF1 [Tribulus terrestris]QIH29924.1 hypothetical chloroplast RF1 [Tribulus terrestris]